MKKISKLIGIILVGLLLVGCGKEKSKELTLCEKIDTIMTDYENDKITFSDLAEKLEKESSDYCDGEDNTICTSIRAIKDHNERTYDLKDCSTYQEGSLKDVCEATNQVVQESLSKKEELEKAYATNLIQDCKLAAEEE